MLFRKLRREDFGGIESMIMSVYAENGLSLWFTGKPTTADLAEMLDAKLTACCLGAAADIVAVENGAVVGECEIVKTAPETGNVGIIVMKGFRRRKAGSALLEKTMRAARSIGITEVYADVAEGNMPAAGFFLSAGFSVVESMGGTSKIRGKSRNILVLRAFNA